jgi:hypothetical protein
MLAREWLTNLANDIPVSIWYDWRDDGRDPTEPEHHFGTVLNAYYKRRDPVYVPKPAFRAAKTLTSILNGYRFSKRLGVGGEDDYVLVFNKTDAVRLAAWTTSDTAHSVVIPSSPGRFRVTAHTGEDLRPLDAGQEGLSVTLTDTPQYLAPDVGRGAQGFTSSPAEAAALKLFAAKKRIQNRTRQDPRRQRLCSVLNAEESFLRGLISVPTAARRRSQRRPRIRS